MKIYSKIAVCAAALLCSCSSLMDAPKDDRIDLDMVFRSKNMMQNYLSHLYWYMGSYGWEGGFIYDGNRSMLSSFCDEAVDSRNQEPGSKINRWYSGENTAESFGFNQEQTNWGNYYAAIRRCNTVIHYLGDPGYVIPASQFNDGYRNYYLAQCYIMRAYNYLELIKRYGGVPIVMERLELSHDFSKDSRASFAQCVDQILDDCDKGLEIGMEKAQPALAWSFGAGMNVRDMTAAIAWMVKSEAVTFAASPLWADDHAGTDKYTWERALEVTVEALEQCVGNGYALQNFTGSGTAETAQNITNYFLTAPDFSGSADKETIQVVVDNENRVPRSKVWQYCGVPESGQLSAGSCPTQELVDAYEITDGTVAHTVLDLAGPYDPATHAPNINPKATALGYTDNGSGMYLNRDPRFYATVYYNGSSRNGLIIRTRTGGSHEISSDPTNIRNTRTGYYLKKYSNPLSSVSDNQDGYNRFYRLAHLYLNYIEALNNVYGPTGVYSATSLPEQSALDALNRLRSTRGMPSVAQTDVADKEAFELRYRNERRVELAFEGKRFFDVRRWQSPSGSLDGTDRQLSGMVINAGETVYTRSIVSSRMCYGNKYLIFPIPNDEIKKINNLTGENWQNPGW